MLSIGVVRSACFLQIALLNCVALSAEPHHSESQGHCAVRVAVVYPGGLPANTEVRLLDPAGKVVATRMSWQGEASFCDFGFGEHTIVVGGERCGSVMVRGIRVHPESQRFHVVLNRCAERAGYGFPPACLVYFRFSARDGIPLQAQVSMPNDSRVLVADRYGRLWVGAEEGAAQEYVIAAAGYAPKRVVVQCNEMKLIEKAVVLEKVGEADLR